MDNLQACLGDSPSVNELLAPDPRIQGGACRSLAASHPAGTLDAAEPATALFRWEW